MPGLLLLMLLGVSGPQVDRFSKPETLILSAFLLHTKGSIPLSAAICPRTHPSPGYFFVERVYDIIAKEIIDLKRIGKKHK